MSQLLCGAAKIKITPSPELLPYMFGLIGQKYGRVHDDLYLRVMAVGAGEKKALIVVYDLDKATNPEEWTAMIEEETGIPADNILYLAIHTHTAPLTGYRPFEGPNFIERKSPEEQENVHKYEDFLKEQLKVVVKEAIANMVPARMGYGRGECYIAVNRCQQYNVKGEDGVVRPEMNIGMDPHGIMDPTLLVLRMENAETGEPICFFTNYAVHCVAAFQNRCDDGKAFLSSDIGGTVSKEMEKEYPGAVALWTSAPAGDINPSHMIQNFIQDAETGKPTEEWIPGEKAADMMIRLMAGSELASIREVLRSVKCTISDGEIRTAVDWAKTEWASNGFTSDEPVFDQEYEIRTHLVQIGPLALVGVDGELYTSLGQAMKAVSPVADTFIMNHDSSLLLNNPGYIMDDAMMQKLKECEGRGAGRGGVPGGKIYTRPGSVKKALEESTVRLFEKA